MTLLFLTFHIDIQSFNGLSFISKNCSSCVMDIIEVVNEFKYLSVRDSNKKSFEFNSQAYGYYPSVFSTERFYGRKCFEYELIDGNGTLHAGIETDLYYFYIFHFKDGSTIFRQKYRPTDTDTDYIFDNAANLNERYMICFDTLLQKMMFINNTEIHTLDIICNRTDKAKTFLGQGQYGYKSTAMLFNDYPFENSIPYGFFSLMDHRNYISVTCRYHKNDKLYFFFQIIAGLNHS